MNRDASHSPEAISAALPPDTPPPMVTPPSVKFCHFLYRLSRFNPAIDRLLTPTLRHRHYLATAAAEDLIPRFTDTVVGIRDVPRGLWATPLVDTVTVVKAAIGFNSKRILEIGSYKGNTSLLLAESTDESTHIWALDREPEHGEAYRGTPLESRIHRVVGHASYELLEPYGKFDLIFVDADHDYNAAYHDTVCAFKLLAPGGVILWHDYHNKSFLHGFCGVPEALDAVMRTSGRSIVSIDGTTVAIYSESPGWETSRIERSVATGRVDPWADKTIHSD